ncbi:MAG: hypothetical protein ACHP79_04790 [Terriglobales bacterium]
MSMRMQVAEVGTYEITLYRNNAGLWDFWVKQKGRLLVRSTGTADCEETKLLVQEHLYEMVMTKKEKKHFDPGLRLEWRNFLHTAEGNPEIAG